MAAQLRWILLGLSAVLLTGIWWWGARRSRQSPGDARLRETSAAQPGAFEHEPLLNDSPGWGVPPFEPLSIRTADFDEVQTLDLCMTASPLPHASDFSLDVYAEETLPEVAQAGSDGAPMTAAPVPAQPIMRETERIVTVRVCAAGDSRWTGTDLLMALETHGLAAGRYKVFHRAHSDGRSLFCAASLVEPGTFDVEKMPTEEFRGVILFAVLPGPAEPLQTVDVLIATAAELADTLHGEVQDSKGLPLTAQRAEALREDVARFQSLLA